MKKILPKTYKEKKQGTLRKCLGLPIGCMKFLFQKEFLTTFGLGQYPLQKTNYISRGIFPLQKGQAF
jgi:hypothetical protein